MFNFDSKAKIALKVVTYDETADVFVVDANFGVAGRARGESSDFKLKPGIYTVKVRVGFESREKDVLLADAPAVVEFELVEFRSSIPLLHTARTHEYQIDAAQRESRRIHKSVGSGSFIFVFARDWSPESRSTRKASNKTPHRGLRLKGGTEGLLVDIEEAAVTDTTGDAWAACTIEVDPGVYRLTVDLDGRNTIEQTVVACSGWQTQVFFLQRVYGPFGSSKRRQADLGNTGILMCATKRKSASRRELTSGFDASDPKMRLVDLARIGLSNSRQVLSQPAIDRILYGKFRNPMLGILGGQLLLKSKSVKAGTLATVVANLRKLLGSGSHPDVEALALRLDKKMAKYRFQLPPMLRQSWLQVVDATKTEPELIPSGSFASDVSSRVLNDEPWLLYMSAESTVISEDAVEQSVKYLIAQQRRRAEQITLSDGRTMKSRLREDEELGFMDEKEGGSFDNVDAEKSITFDEGRSAGRSVRGGKKLNKKQLNNLVDQTSLPRSKVEEILERISES